MNFNNFVFSFYTSDHVSLDISNSSSSRWHELSYPTLQRNCGICVLLPSTITIQILKRNKSIEDTLREWNNILI